jgi:hypothetical protein
MVDSNYRSRFDLVLAFLEDRVLVGDAIFLLVRIHFRKGIGEYLFTLLHGPVGRLIIDE